MTAYLQALLRERRKIELDVGAVNALKEAHAYAKLHPHQAANKVGVAAASTVDASAPRAGATFALPDGKSFDVHASAAELAQCVESLYEPELVGRQVYLPSSKHLSYGFFFFFFVICNL